MHHMCQICLRDYIGGIMESHNSARCAGCTGGASETKTMGTGSFKIAMDVPGVPDVLDLSQKQSHWE